MSVWRTAFLVGLALWVSALSCVCAQTDQNEVHWQGRLQLPMHWDNIESSEAGSGGAEPRYRGGLHLLTLSPDEHATVALPANSVLRVFSPDKVLHAQDLELAWSAGSGLFAPLDEAALGDEHTRYWLAPVGDTPGVVWLHRPKSFDRALTFAVFVSRPPEVADMTYYRDVVDLDAPRVRIARQGVAGSKHFWHLQQNVQTTVQVEGLDRLAVQTRYLFPDAAQKTAALYRVYVALDGRPWKTLTFDTTLDVKSAGTVQGCRRALGWLETGYVDIPQGRHTLSFSTPAALFIRVLGHQASNDLLIPRNRSVDYPLAVQARATLSAVDDLSDTAVTQGLQDPTTPLEDLQTLAYHMTRDNRHRGGALLASALLRRSNAASEYPLRVRQGVNTLLARHSFFRPLLPSNAVARGDQRFAWYGREAVREPDDFVNFPLGYAQNLAAGMSGGYFVSVSARASQANEYVLPQREADTHVRIALARGAQDEALELMLQFDSRQPQVLRFMPQAVVADGAAWPGHAQGALAFIDGHHEAPSATLGGGFSLRNTPASRVDAAVVELVLPQEVSVLRLWRRDHARASNTARVALAYRSARDYRLSETDYLSALHVLSPAVRQALMDETLSAFSATSTGLLQAASPAQTDAAYDLVNQWQPLKRLLNSRSRAFISTLGPAPDALQSIDTTQAQRLTQQGEAAEHEQDWSQALSFWARLARARDAGIRDRARYRTVSVLVRAGEPYLAEQTLRALVVYAQDGSVREQAVEALLARYQGDDKLSQRLNLLAWLVQNRGHARWSRALSQALHDTGDDYFALILALNLAPEAQDPELILSAAYAQTWWISYAQTIARLPSAEQQAYWRGYHALALGHYQEAARHWRAANAQDLLARLREGLRIRQALRAPDLAQRRQAVLDWETWQGAWTDWGAWRSEHEHVSAHAGALSLYSQERSLSIEAFKSTPEQVFKAQVYGPVKLRLALRPLHAKSDHAPIDDWMVLQDGDQTRVYPIINNMPSSDLSLPGEPGLLPGSAVYSEFDLGPGLHELRLSTRQYAALVRLQIKRARLAWRVLPPLSSAAVDQVLAGRYVDVPEASLRDRDDVQAYQVCGSDYRVDANPPRGFAVPDGRGDADTRQSRLPGDLFAQRIDGIDPLVEPHVLLDATYDSQSLVEGLIALLWHSEQQGPHARIAQVARAEAMLAQDPGSIEGQRIVRRMREGISWALLTGVRSSAGLHVIESTMPVSEHPRTRLREALMVPSARGERLLSGNDRLTLTLNNQRATRFKFAFRLQTLPYNLIGPLSVRLQLDEGAVQMIKLTPGQVAREVLLRIGAGSHIVSIALQDPALGLSVQLQVLERGAKGQWFVVNDPSERIYQVASAAEPLQLSVQGPTWLRIDEYTAKERTRSVYQFVDDGWHDLHFGPTDGQRQSLYRVFELAERMIQRPPTPLRTALLAPPPQSRWAVNPSAPLARLVLPADRFALAGQEDGSWSAGLSGVARRSLDEDLSNRGGQERFLELDATHRYFAAQKNVYFRSQALIRAREKGGPTLGLREFISFTLPRYPLDIDAQGLLYAQNPGGALSTAYAATVRGSVSQRRILSTHSWHRPQFTAYARYLSVDQRVRVQDRGRLDQDVYTQYKRDHLAGLKLSDAFYYSPWKDTLTRVQLGAMSNEDARSLDYVDLTLGAWQLLGDVSVGADVAQRYYQRDSDREDKSTRTLLGWQADWRRWFTPRYGFEANIKVQRDLDSGDTSASVGLRFNYANARLYRDYRARDMRFRELRQRRELERHFLDGGD